VIDVFEKPSIIRTPTNNAAFIIANWLLTLIGVVGVWYTRGFYHMLVAFIVKLAIGKMTFNHYYKEAYRKYCWYYLSRIQESFQAEGKEMDDISMKVDAQRLAQEKIRKNMNHEMF
jgi:hypothetical protein